MDAIRGKINKNYIAAKRSIDKYPFYILIFSIYILFVFIAFSADYALSFSFFSKIHENEMGQLTTDKVLTVALKAILPLAVAVVLKFIFVKIPKPIQNILFGILFVLALVTIVNIGMSQMRPMKIKAMDEIFPIDVQLPTELTALFGEDEFNDISNTPPDLETLDSNSSKEEFAIQRNKFKKEFTYYGYAFLMITAFGVLSWIKLGELYSRMQEISMLKQTIIIPYRKLQQKENQLNEIQEKIKYLEANKIFIFRLFQDVAVKAYKGGLVVPKTYLNDLIAFGDPHGDAKRYPRFQVYLRRRMLWVNIERLSEMIREAEKSVDDLYFINTPQEFSPKINSKNNKLNTLKPKVVLTKGEGVL